MAGLFVRYQLAVDQALGESPAAPAADTDEPPPRAWWEDAGEPLVRLAHVAEAIAHTAWTYRFLFRDLSDLVSRHRVLEEGLPPLLRRQAQALTQALRALPWREATVDEAALAAWTGPLLASLTGSTGLDGALDPRELLRESGPHAVDVALARALGLLRPALSGPDRALLDTHLGPGDAFGMDPWWLGRPAS